MTMLLLLCSMVACASALIHNDCVADVSSRCKAAALPVKCADWVNTVTDPEYDKFHEFGASKARVADAVRNLLQKLCVYTKLETKSLTFALFTLLAPPQCKAITANVAETFAAAQACPDEVVVPFCGKDGPEDYGMTEDWCNKQIMAASKCASKPIPPTPLPAEPAPPAVKIGANLACVLLCPSTTTTRTLLTFDFHVAYF